MNKFVESFKKTLNNHPILWNLLFIVLVLLVIGWFTPNFLDYWTHHGQTTRVPDVMGMPLEKGIEELHNANLEIVISDSTYSKDIAPGTIVDVVPQPNSVVKAGREVYVTIIAFSPEPLIIETLLVNLSARDAISYLESKGINYRTVYVPSEHDELVVGAKCNGANLTMGSKITVNDTVVLEIGKKEELQQDNTQEALDNLINILDIEEDTHIDTGLQGTPDDETAEEQLVNPGVSADNPISADIEKVNQVINAFSNKKQNGDE